MANYLLHNLGYDQPINFRYIVLDTLKRYGVCVHLRDYSTNHWGLTDVNEWLQSTDYYEDNLKKAKKALKEYKAQLKKIEDGDETYIKEEYEKKLRVAESYRSCQHSWNIDEADSIDKCANEYYKYLTQLNLSSIPGELGKNLKRDLWDIYETAIRDREEHLKQDKEDVEHMHQAKDPIYEDVKIEVIVRLEGYVEWQNRMIKEAKENIKRIKRNNEIIKEIFNQLDLVDKMVGDEK